MTRNRLIPSPFHGLPRVRLAGFILAGLLATALTVTGCSKTTYNASTGVTGGGGGGGGGNNTPPHVAQGVLDTTFNATGYAFTSFTGGTGGTNASLDSGRTVTKDSSGNTLVMGSTYTITVGGPVTTFWRFTPAGAPDTTFGTGGVVMMTSQSILGSAMVVDGAGNLLVAGSSAPTGGGAVARFTPAGALDTTFGTGGIAMLPSMGTIGVNALAIDGSGNILVGGGIFSAPASGLLARFTPAGALDTTFGTGGVVITSATAGGVDDSFSSLVLDAAGRIITTGTSQQATNTNYDAVVWRFTSAGAPDATFGTGGHVALANPTGNTTPNDMGYALAVDAAGNIVVAGQIFAANGGWPMTLWRLTPSGAADATFGSGGAYLAPSASGQAAAFTSELPASNSLAFDAAGNIVVAGSTSVLNGMAISMALWRFTPAGAPDASFGCATATANATGYNCAPGYMTMTGTAGAATSNDPAAGLYLDPLTQNITVTGISSPAAGGSDMAVWQVK